MSTIIQIKRSTSALAPNTTTLVEGELAYSYDKSNDGANAILYVEVLDSGNSEVIHKIGGKYYTDIVDTATASNTANKLVKRDGAGGFAGNVYGRANVAASLDSTYVNNVSPGTGVTVTGTHTVPGANLTIALADTAVTPGSYGGASQIPTIIIDQKGRVTFAANNAAAASSFTIRGNSGTDTFNTGDVMDILGVAPGISTAITDNTISITNTGVSNIAATANHITVNQGTGNVTLSLPNSGVTATTYGGADKIPVITFDAQGRATFAANASSSFLTASSIATLTNKTFDVSVGSNNIFSIQGNQISSYSGSGLAVLLDNLPTINGINIGNGSQLTIDGGTGTYYWSGQSGVAQAGDHKAGVYASSPTANNSIFTFGTNGSNYMSVGVEGSLFVGTATPSNNGGLNSSYAGWLVVQSGGKFGGTINTLGALQFDDASTGKIIFANGTEQNTAFRTALLNTSNVYELGSNVYFSNARARDALTSGNGIVYNSVTGNITLSTTGVTATTYGGTTNIPVITVDAYGRLTSAANATISTDLTISGNTGSDTVSLATETLAFRGGSGIDTVASGNTITIVNTGVTGITASSPGLVSSASTGSITLTNTGVTGLTSAGHGVVYSGSSGNITTTFTGVGSVTGTANEIEVNASTGNVTIGLPNNVTVTQDLSVGRDLSVTGNLYVTGNVVALPTEQLVIEDSLIQLANNNISADLIDIGFYGSYNFDGGTHEHAGLFRDASDSGKFKLFQGLQNHDNLSTTINTSGTGYSVATLVANLTGGSVTGLSANVVVADGGTGRGVLTANTILAGDGVNPVRQVSGTSGQILQIGSDGMAKFGVIDGGTY